MISYPTAINKTSTNTSTNQSSSSTSKMIGSDLEKGAGVQMPTAAHTSNRESFLPSYEKAVNDNMRNFEEVNLQPFDHIQEPKRKGTEPRCMKREWILAAIIAIMFFAIAMPLGIIAIVRQNHTSDKQTTIIQTRSTSEMAFSFAPVTVVTVAPSTVYVTVTPTPSPSTPIVTLTTTLPQSESTTSQSQSTETVTSVSVSLSVSVSTATMSTPTTSTTSSTTTSSTSTSTSSTTSSSTTSTSTTTSTTSSTTSSTIMSPEESAAWSSVRAQQSKDLAALTIVPTTLLSITTKTVEHTSEDSPLPTMTGFLSFCGVDGAQCPR